MGKRDNLKEISENYLLRAHDKIKSAKFLLEKQQFADSISFSYFAAFLSSKAILLLIGEW